MDVSELRSAFAAVVGEHDYRRFVQELNSGPTCLRGGRLRFWQERLWDRFLARHPTYNLTFEQLQSTFRICYLHGCELESSAEPLLSGARSDAVPFAQGPFVCPACRQARVAAEGSPLSVPEPVLGREEFLAALQRELANRGRPELLEPFALAHPSGWTPRPGGSLIGALAEYLIRQAEGIPAPPEPAVEWELATDPVAMLLAVRALASARKLRLFACACCRRIWPLLHDEAAREAVAVAERYADGQATDEELGVAHKAAGFAQVKVQQRVAPAVVMGSFSDPEYQFVHAYRAAAQAAAPHDSDALLRAAESASHAVFGLAEYRDDYPKEYVAVGVTDDRPTQARLLRCILGNPHRPKPSGQPWRDLLHPDVLRLAWRLYEDRQFTPVNLARLSDGLEEAGCTDERVLGHLRQEGEHARGCWVLDLCLGLS